MLCEHLLDEYLIWVMAFGTDNTLHCPICDNILNNGEDDE